MLLSSYQSWTLKVTGNVTRIWVAEHNQAIRVSGNREKQENAAKNFLQFTLIWWTQTRTFFISVFNQLDAQNFCFTISFISCLYMFRAHVLNIRRSKLHYTASGIITAIGGRLVHHTRGCVIQFWPPDDEHMCSKHVEAWNKTYCKTKILCIKLVNYRDKYTEKHGQQNVKKMHSLKWLIFFWN